ncbi:hypothetical protein ACJX0J_023340, partial [Zea mays]
KDQGDFFIGNYFGEKRLNQRNQHQRRTHQVCSMLITKLYGMPLYSATTLEFRVTNMGLQMKPDGPADSDPRFLKINFDDWDAAFKGVVIREILGVGMLHGASFVWLDNFPGHFVVLHSLILLPRQCWHCRLHKYHHYALCDNTVKTADSQSNFIEATANAESS